jgi:hypothetical protein
VLHCTRHYGQELAWAQARSLVLERHAGIDDAFHDSPGSFRAALTVSERRRLADVLELSRSRLVHLADDLGQQRRTMQSETTGAPVILLDALLSANRSLTAGDRSISVAKPFNFRWCIRSWLPIMSTVVSAHRSIGR